MANRRETAHTSKSERTRNRILEAASQLILERGGKDFQMSEVAARCDMSKGALYYYFPDRDAIVEEIFNRASDVFADRLESVIANSVSAREAIHALIRVLCETVRDDGLFVAAMASELHNGGSFVLPQLRERFNRISRLAYVQLERAKVEGLVRADIDSALSADTICGAVLFGASRTALDQKDAFDAEATSEHLYHIVMTGVGAAT